jgi:drug/metabolite transporter (DMT)-like permease
MRKARLEGLHAAAIAGVGSLVLYLPVYAAVAGTAIFTAPLFDVALKAIVQGLLTAIVALLLYGRIVSIMGATGGAAFVALMPAMTALMGIPILGEWPSASDWVAVAVISSGMYLVPGVRFRHADDVGIIPIVCDEIRARNPARFLPNIGIMILSG